MKFRGGYFIVSILLALALLPLVVLGEESINFQHPSQVTSGQTFSTSIELFNGSQEIYDVKIEIFNSTNGRISQILNEGTWQSTFYYVVGKINTSQSNSSSFDLNITQDYGGEATINVTLRGSSTYKFGPYSLNVNSVNLTPPVSNQTETSNRSTDSSNQTSSTQTQNQTQTNSCSGVQVANITEHPYSLRFGDLDKVIVSFRAGCYSGNYTKMLVYGSESRVIANKTGNKIISYSSCQQGTEFANLIAKNYSFEVPFYVYSNCDSKYKEENYSISLRVCDSDGSKYYEQQFNLSIDGTKTGICSDATAESDIGEAVAENRSSEKLLPASKSVKLSGGANSSETGKEQIIYRSSDLKSMTVTAYLAGILFLLICAYLLVCKGKV